MRLLNEALLRVMATFEGMRPHREEGQTLVEYALIIALISIAAIAVMVTLGGKISSTFTNIAGHLV
jgi:pilus assembly protein Flp/PilA